MSFLAGCLWSPLGKGAPTRAPALRSAEPSIEPVANGSRFRRLAFSDDFDVFDLSRWKHELTMGGGGNWEFSMYVNNRSNSFVKDGVLHIHPTLTESVMGAHEFANGGELDLWGNTPASECTGNAFFGCRREAGGGGNVVNPVQSARLRSYESFRFKYGRVEIRAKFPRGKWLWPALWMLPVHEAYGKWPASGEIDIAEARGNYGVPGGSSTIGSTLHFGPSWQEDPWSLNHAEYTLPGQEADGSGPDFADDWHVFGLYWGEDEIYTYVDSDDNVVLRAEVNESFWAQGLRHFPAWEEAYENPWRASPNVNAPYDQEMFLIVNLAVGGTNPYFPDDMPGKPWRGGTLHAVNDFWAARDDWLPTWKGEDCDLRIDYVRVWQD